MKSMLSGLRRVIVGASLGVAAVAAVPADAEPASGAAAFEYVRFTTPKGDVVLELNQAKAPITVQNFLKYVDDGFFADTVIHRSVNGSIGVIQGGGYTADLKEKTAGEPIKNEWGNGLTNRRGTISMARTANPDSATSQWFINTRDNAPLDRALPQSGSVGYAVFGQVIGGMDVVDAIAAIPVAEKTLTARGGQTRVAGDVPSELVAITKAERIKAEDVSELIAAARAAEANIERAAAEARAAESAKAREAGAQSLTTAQEFLKSKEIDVSKGAFTDSGLWYVDIVEGTGAPASRTSNVTAHYTGWLTSGEKFDSSVDRGQPATFNLQGVIPGWTEGVGTMKTGGKRILVIRPELGYGSRSVSTIPANSTLVFEVELLGVQ